jgi:hypothetical protein
MAEHPARSWPLLTVAAGLVLLAGCAGPAAAPAATSPSSAASPSGHPPAVPGQLRVDGAVDRPVTLSIAQLAAMPGRTVAVRFGTEHGSQQHTETGVTLRDLVDRAGPALTPGRKHDVLSFGVLVVGSDGYRTLLSYGEISPAAGNRDALLATSEDGHPLAAPRLVLPGDVQGARYVSGVVELDVIHPG